MRFLADSQQLSAGLSLARHVSPIADLPIVVHSWVKGYSMSAQPSLPAMMSLP